MTKENFLSEPFAKIVSAPCSAGKTHAACEYIRKHSSQNFIYVAPSLELLKQSELTMRKMGISPDVITSDTHPGHVRRNIIAYLNDEIGSLLLVTWQAYVDLPYHNRPQDWQVIIDEVPQVDRFFPWKLPRNLHLLTEHVDCGPAEESSTLGLLMVKDRDALEEKLEDVRDDVDELFRPFFRELLNDKKQMFVDLGCWNRLVEDGEVSSKEESNRLYCLSLLLPEAVQGSIILGANIEDSLLARLLEKEGLGLQKHEEITRNLRQVPPDLASRLRVSYFIPGKDCSKRLYRTTHDSRASLIDRMDTLALATFGTDRFLYVANNDRRSPVLHGHSQVHKIPVFSHGLNTYDSYNNIYFSAALHREPKHFTMLENLGSI